MILGTGIDAVNINRFDTYQTQPHEMLAKLFSPQEIDYCLSKKRPATHFAARFAAREAFFKAYQAMLVHYNAEHPANLFTINKKIALLHTPKGVPYLDVTWPDLLPQTISIPRVHISITHTHEVATAIVVLEQSF